MNPLPKSSILVLRALGSGGMMTHKDIVKKTHCSPRTVRSALKKLKDRGLLVMKMDLQDMRQILYKSRIPHGAGVSDG